MNHLIVEKSENDNFICLCSQLHLYFLNPARDHRAAQWGPRPALRATAHFIKDSWIFFSKFVKFQRWWKVTRWHNYCFAVNLYFLLFSRQFLLFRSHPSRTSDHFAKYISWREPHYNSWQMRRYWFTAAWRFTWQRVNLIWTVIERSFELVDNFLHWEIHSVIFTLNP